MLLQSDEKSSLHIEGNVGIMSTWPNILFQEIQETVTSVLRDGLLLSSKEQVINMIFTTLLGKAIMIIMAYM